MVKFIEFGIDSFEISGQQQNNVPILLSGTGYSSSSDEAVDGLVDNFARGVTWKKWKMGMQVFMELREPMNIPLVLLLRHLPKKYSYRPKELVSSYKNRVPRKCNCLTH